MRRLKTGSGTLSDNLDVFPRIRLDEQTEQKFRCKKKIVGLFY